MRKSRIMDNKKLKPSLEYVMTTIINQFKNDVAKGQKMHFLVIQVLQEWIFEKIWIKEIIGVCDKKINLNILSLNLKTYLQEWQIFEENKLYHRS